MRSAGTALLAVLGALLIAACGTASTSRPAADTVVNVSLNGHRAEETGLAHGVSHRALARLPHRAGLGLSPARRAALLRKDPALRFVLLDVPHDPPLHRWAPAMHVARRVLSTRIDGQHVIVILPRHSNGRAILFAHGSDETPDYDIDVMRSGRLIRSLVAAGYTWAESNAGYNNWGDAASLREDVAVAHWLRAHGLERIDIGGDSMGGLDATQLIPLVHPEAVFELFPVANERSVWHLFSVDIVHADADLSALSPVRVRGAQGLPMLITASPHDTLVRKSENADVLAREARAAGAQVDEVTTTGEHDDPSNWKVGRILRFLNTAALEARLHDTSSGYGALNRHVGAALGHHHLLTRSRSAKRAECGTPQSVSPSCIQLQSSPSSAAAST